MRKIVIATMLLTLTGCASIDMATEGVKRYCAALSWPERMAIRERVNAQVYPHKVVIDCAGGVR
jgi:uncharacterized protein YceK